MSETLVKMTPEALKTKIQEAKDEGRKSFENEIKEKGLDFDNIDEIIKSLKEPKTTNITVGEDREKHYPLGKIALATAYAKMHTNGKSAIEVLKDESEMTGNDTGLKLALNAMHKTYQSQDGNRLKTFEHEVKTIGLATLLDGSGSDFANDLEVSPLLRPTSTLFQLEGTKRRTLVNGEYRKQVRQTGMTGYWVGESDNVTESEGATTNLVHRAKRAAGFTTLSKSAVLLSNKSLERDAQEELVEAVSEAVDTAFFTGTGSAYQPLGLANLTGVVTKVATESATAIQVGQDLDTLRANMVSDNNIRLRNPYWLGTEAQKVHYGSKYTSNGQIMNYARDLINGNLSGIKYHATNYASSDNSVLYLIDASHLYISSGYGLIVDLDDHYNVQSGLIGIRAEIALDFGFDRPEAVGKLTSADEHI